MGCTYGVKDVVDPAAQAAKFVAVRDQANAHVDEQVGPKQAQKRLRKGISLQHLGRVPPRLEDAGGIVDAKRGGQARDHQAAKVGFAFLGERGRVAPHVEEAPREGLKATQEEGSKG